MADKSECVAYLLWLSCGVFGAHHFYLGRDRQALLWFVTYGGFLYGWLMDVGRISDYVNQANNHPACQRELDAKRKKCRRPSFSVGRCVAQWMVGKAWGYLARAATPDLTELGLSSWDSGSVMSRVVAALLVALLVALAVHCVGNVGQCRGGLRAPLVAAGGAAMLAGPDAVGTITCSSIAAFEIFSKRWPRKAHTQPSRSLCCRLLILLTASVLFYSLWLSYFYFNASIELQDGEKMLVRDAARTFFASPLWTRLRAELVDAGRVWARLGLRVALKSLLNSWDPSGERGALRVLGLLPDSASLSPEVGERRMNMREISRRYRQLSRSYHPDKFVDVEEKRLAEARFTQINVAYDLLTRLHRRRNSRQHYDGDDHDDDESQHKEEL